MDLDENLIQRINVGDMLTRTAALRPTQLALVDRGVDGERRWSTPRSRGGTCRR
jgi:long-chain acyl-CoA synthetase